MLIATQGKNVAATRQYFDQVLTQGDYYLGQEINGRWHGRGADTLGLGQGTDVTKEQFSALLQGKHPHTNEQLTQRNRKDRRPGVDLTYSVPKSVSLAWAINGDERIVDALRDTVRESMMKDVEPLMQRRVRTGRHANSEQKSTTGELVYADFLHKTSRPVEGKADPHLHIHAFVINWTHENGKHYAGQFEEIVRQRPSLQAKFESRLARRLKHELGYDVEKTRYVQSGRSKSGWELTGIERSTIEKFSRRTGQVEQHAQQHGIRDAAKKGQLSAKTREAKDRGASIDRLRQEWTGRLDDQERLAFERLAGGVKSGKAEEGRADVTASIQYALDHHLYRQSTVERHQVVGTALEHGLTYSPEQVEQALDRMDVIERSIEKDGAERQLVTTREVLNAERRMISYARDGRGTRSALLRGDHEFNRDWLGDQQREAVKHVLHSRDAVIAVTGGAGTGKSSLMQEAAVGIARSGRKLFTFAPSTGAKEVLEEKGFSQTQTVEHLIRNTSIHDSLRDQVLWIDEAGLLDVRSMNAVFEIAGSQNARVVLSGDTRQHASPRRGEAMRLLEQEAGLNIARVEAIQRQQGRYRAAVEKISLGHEMDEETGKPGLLAGFDMLDRMGKIQEIDDERKHEILAERYLQSEQRGQSTLVISPTHAEAEIVTDHIRQALHDEGKLDGEEQVYSQLRSLHLTEAEKGEAETYAGQVGAVVQFHQNAKGGIRRGERYRVAGAIGKKVEIVSLSGGDRKQLPLKNADRFEVYRESEVGLRRGDKVRFTLGGTTRDGKGRISNGRLDEVKRFDRSGNLVLKGGQVIDQDYGHLDLGYVVTSHASQGKDRQLAIAAMGSESLPAINAKQFYVTVSRGSDDVIVFVDDKTKVRRAIARSGEQLSATEMTRSETDGSVSSSDRSANNEVNHLRQTAFQAFRDRLSAWWKGRAGERRQASVTPGFNTPAAGFGNVAGWGGGNNLGRT